jgi:cytidylate kinase|tara:strand:+ start:56688 stop:57341 length:654 start_codon:yes stop_codon:yes gene_type:complete
MPAIITIDGPGGSGKGTVTCLVAEQLGFRSLDSGALYRILALDCIQKGVEASQVDIIAKRAGSLEVEFVNGKVLLEGEDVTDAIRGEEIGEAASKIAIHPAVREELLYFQKSFVVAPGLVADGRDMGTQVFPQAELKIYLTASAEERAKRRYKQLIDAGQGGSLRALVDGIQARDQRDLGRETAPLRPAEDSILIDSTGMTIKEVVKQILDLWHKTH